MRVQGVLTLRRSEFIYKNKQIELGDVHKLAKQNRDCETLKIRNCETREIQRQFCETHGF